MLLILASRLPEHVAHGDAHKVVLLTDCMTMRQKKSLRASQPMELQSAVSASREMTFASSFLTSPASDLCSLRVSKTLRMPVQMPRRIKRATWRATPEEEVGQREKNRLARSRFGTEEIDRSGSLLVDLSRSWQPRVRDITCSASSDFLLPSLRLCQMAATKPLGHAWDPRVLASSR